MKRLRLRFADDIVVLCQTVNSLDDTLNGVDVALKNELTMRVNKYKKRIRKQ